MSIQVHFQIGSFSCLLHSWNLNSLHSYMEFLRSLASIMGLSNDVQVLPWQIHRWHLCISSFYPMTTLLFYHHPQSLPHLVRKASKVRALHVVTVVETQIFSQIMPSCFWWHFLPSKTRKRKKWQTYAIHWWICMAIFIIQQLFCFRERMWVGLPKRCQSHLQRGR